MSLISSHTSASVVTDDYSGAPISLETERRRTMRIVHRVEKDIIAFREKCLKKARTTDFLDDMHDLVQFVMDRNQLKRFPKNINDFCNLLGKVRDSAENLYKTEVMTIDAAITLYKTYHETMQVVTGKLKNAIDNHCGKYCHSYSSECGVYEIPSVQFYENNITKWRGQIKEAFVLLDDIMRNIRDSSMTMDMFLQNWPRVVHYMGLSLDVFPRIFNSLKDWVTADEAYLRHVQDDMSELKREKMALDSVTRRHKMVAGGIQSKVTRSQHHTKKLKEKLLRARDERRQCRKKQLVLMETSSKLASDLNEKKQELDISMQQFYRAGGPSNSAKVKLLDSSSSLSQDIAKLEKKMNALNGDLRSVKIERMAAQKEFHKMQVLVEKNSKLELDIRDDAHDATQDVLDIDEERRVLGEKVMAIARIRAIKSDPRTVKIIYAEGYTPGRKFDVPPELEKACRVGAQEVGWDWPGHPLSPRRESGRVDTSGTVDGLSLSPRGAKLKSDTPMTSISGRVAGSGSSSTTFRSVVSVNRNGACGARVGAGGARRRTTSGSEDDCPTYRCLDRWQRVSQEASGNALGRLSRSIRNIGSSDGVQDKQEITIITVN